MASLTRPHTCCTFIMQLHNVHLLHLVCTCYTFSVYTCCPFIMYTCCTFCVQLQQQLHCLRLLDLYRVHLQHLPNEHRPHTPHLHLIGGQPGGSASSDARGASALRPIPSSSGSSSSCTATRMSRCTLVGRVRGRLLTQADSDFQGAAGTPPRRLRDMMLLVIMLLVLARGVSWRWCLTPQARGCLMGSPADVPG